MRYFPIDLGCALIVAPHMKRVRGLPPWLEVFNLLSRARSFQSIHDIVVNSGGEPSQIDCQSAEAEFSKLCESGILVSDVQLSRRQSDKHRSSTEATIAFLGVIFSNHKSSVLNCIDSYFVNACDFGRKMEIVVVDNTYDPGAESQNRTALADWALQKKIDVFYAAVRERKDFVNLLAKMGIPYDIGEFAILGAGAICPKSGAVRNSLLLHGAGEMFTMVEADTLCLPLTHPYCEQHDLLLSESATICAWFFASKQQGLKSGVQLKKDFFGAHSSMVGHTLPTIIDQFSRGSDNLFGSLCSHMITSLLSGNGKVAAATNGVLGRPNSLALIDALRTADDATLLRITASEQKYKQAVQAAAYLRTSQCLTVSHRGNCFPQVLSLDSRELTLPFVPLGFNEVSTFEWMTTTSLSDLYFAHIPWAIPYDGQCTILVPDGPGLETEYPQFSNLLLACLASRATGNFMRPRPADQVLRALGRFLIELSMLDPKDFDGHLKSLMRDRLEAEISDLNAMLLVYDDRPRSWKSDVCQRLAVRREVENSADFLRPKDTSGGTAGITTQFLVGQYGRLLLWWPEIVAATKELRSQGRRLAQPV